MDALDIERTESIIEEKADSPGQREQEVIVDWWRTETVLVATTWGSEYAEQLGIG